MKIWTSWKTSTILYRKSNKDRIHHVCINFYWKMETIFCHKFYANLSWISDYFTKFSSKLGTFGLKLIKVGLFYDHLKKMSWRIQWYTRGVVDFVTHSVAHIHMDLYRNFPCPFLSPTTCSHICFVWLFILVWILEAEIILCALPDPQLRLSCKERKFQSTKC